MPTHVLTHAEVHTLDSRRERADAIAWREGIIVGVGDERAVLAEHPDAVVTDARGAAVLPGFIDAHQHPCIAALYGGGVRLAPPDVRDIPTLQAKLREAARALPAGEWLVAMDWDEAALDERRAPTREELDAAAPDRPVFALHYSCHRAAANSRALEMAGIDGRTPDPSGGIISRDRRGLPNGLLIERGMSRVETLARASIAARDEEGFLLRLARHFRMCVAAGITRVADAAVPGDLAVLYREADRRGLLPIPTLLMPVATSGYLETPWEILAGAATGARDGNLRVGPVKLILDGAPACAMCLTWWQAVSGSLRTWAQSVAARSLDPIRTALSIRPRLGVRVRSGIHLYRPDEARDFVRSAVEAGFSVASHAEGNEALDVALSAYAAAGSRLGRAGTARLEHVLFSSRDQADRIAGLGVAAVVQPHFLSIPAIGLSAAIPRLPPKPLRWLLDAGVCVAGSSDFPVTNVEPLDGIRDAVFRRVSGGAVREPEQCVDLAEAVAMYTRSAARVLGCLEECGTLEPGKRADLVLLEGPLSTLGDLEVARVRATIVGGDVAFGALGDGAAHSSR